MCCNNKKMKNKDSEKSIIVDNISKIYRLYDNPAGRLKEALWRGKKIYHKKFWALKNISFDVEKGETVGVIGRNGSGKSTLLQLIAGIMPPSSGNIEVNGKVSALLELGSGFDPEYSGRENVYMSGAILGFSREEIDERFDAITEFADIGDFIDQPAKLYSSGMFVRLAFATAINVDPDILLVDEALAVGDTVFQHRCMSKIRDIKEKGKTIFFVSHDIGAVQKLCSRAILLENGEIVCMDKPEKVAEEYFRIVWNVAKNDKQPENIEKNSEEISNSNNVEIKFEKVSTYDNRYGNRKGEIIAFALTDEKGKKCRNFHGGMKLVFSICVKCNEDIDMPLVGIIIKDLVGHELIKTNSDAEGFLLKPCKKNSIMQIDFSFTLPYLKSGSYALSVVFGIGTIENHSVYDWIENIAVFTIEDSRLCYGLIRAPVEIDHKFISYKDIV